MSFAFNLGGLLSLYILLVLYVSIAWAETFDDANTFALQPSKLRRRIRGSNENQSHRGLEGTKRKKKDASKSKLKITAGSDDHADIQSHDSDDETMKIPGIMKKQKNSKKAKKNSSSIDLSSTDSTKSSNNQTSKASSSKRRKKNADQGTAIITQGSFDGYESLEDDLYITPGPTQAETTPLPTMVPTLTTTQIPTQIPTIDITTQGPTEDAIELPGEEFDFSDCDSFSTDWFFDLARTCNQDTLEGCECTTAELLLDAGRITCATSEEGPTSPSACPSQCPVCERCMVLIGCEDIYS